MIYVITHKIIENTEPIDFKHNVILHVGENNQCLESYVRDDTGDNISTKNPNYCELTGLYWIWKNAHEDEEDITGLLHYRRFFTTKSEDFMYKYFDKMPTSLDYSIIEHSLQTSNAIVPQRVHIHSTLKEFYGKFHDISDMDRLRVCVGELYPNYLSAYDQVMNAHSYIYGNMIICRKELLDRYCAWLFDVLFDFEKKYSADLYEGTYQKRIYGFLSERLLQVWLTHNSIKCSEYPAYNTETRTLNAMDNFILRCATLHKKLLGK